MTLGESIKGRGSTWLLRSIPPAPIHRLKERGDWGLAVKASGVSPFFGLLARHVLPAPAPHLLPQPERTGPPALHLLHPALTHISVLARHS